MRAQGVAAGETVVVEMERDDEPRTIDPPDDLRDALAREPEARRFFDRLPYTHRREYVEWIEEAKREETRRRRIEQTVVMLRDSRKQRYSGVTYAEVIPPSTTNVAPLT